MPCLEKKKKGKTLKKCLGLLKESDTEYKVILKDLKKTYKKWTKRTDIFSSSNL